MNDLFDSVSRIFHHREMINLDEVIHNNLCLPRPKVHISLVLVDNEIQWEARLMTEMKWKFTRREIKI